MNTSTLGSKLPNNFYPMTDEIKHELISNYLTKMEFRIWSALTDLDKWGDRLVSITTKALEEVCRCSRTTIWRALNKFKRLGIFTIVNSKVNQISCNRGISQIKDGKIDTGYKNVTSCSLSEIPVTFKEFSLQKCQDESPKSAPCKASKIPQTLSKNTENTDKEADCCILNSCSTEWATSPVRETLENGSIASDLESSTIMETPHKANKTKDLGHYPTQNKLIATLLNKQQNQKKSMC